MLVRYCILKLIISLSHSFIKMQEPSRKWEGSCVWYWFFVLVALAADAEAWLRLLGGSAG